MDDEDDLIETPDEYSSDVHGYVRYRIDREGIDPSKNPQELSNIIEKAASDYVVWGDSDSIETYEYHYITAVRIAKMIESGHEMYHSQANDFFSSIPSGVFTDDEASEIAESIGRYTIGNNVTLVYSMAYEFVDDMLERLLPKILSETVDEGAEDTLNSQISSYNGRADMLSKAGIIDDSTREAIRDIREVRRALVHDVEKRFTLSILEDLNMIDEIPGTLNTLYKMVYDEPAYHYIDE